jgi:hypothetical protein
MAVILSVDTGGSNYDEYTSNNETVGIAIA